MRKYLCASMGDLQLRVSKEEIIFGFPMRREKEKCNKIKLLVENISYVWGQKRIRNKQQMTKKKHIKQQSAWGIFSCSILLAIVIIFSNLYNEPTGYVS